MQVRLLWLAVGVLAVLQCAEWLRAPEPQLDPPGHDAQLAMRIDKLEARLSALESRPSRAELADSERRIEGGTTDVADRIERLERALSAPHRDAAAARAARQSVRKLNRAIARDDNAAIHALLAGGIDVNAKDDDGRTALAAAAIAGRIDLFDTLLAAKADLEKTSGKRRMTPLLAALDADQEDAALALLERGADPRAVDKNGENALEWAAYNGMTRVVQRLTERGGAVRHKNHDGGTALHAAAARGHRDVLVALLRAGADPNTANRAGHTPIDLARKRGHNAIVALLKKHGAR